ncbi:hypothetical protein FRB93_005456 [Tulasnella sp. JGI-2019a]|nr:hypothetical protein FRB93_005456 [Tulasnella sp. JGI-2019a]
MRLVDLPREVLILVPYYLETLQDLHSLMLTCHVLHETTSFPNSQLLLRLACSPYTGLQPYPHLLLAVKSRQLADWAVTDDSHRTKLHDTIREGPESMLKLALQVSPLTVDDLRRLHAARYDVLIPLSEQMDTRYGPGAKLNKDWWTICENLVLSATNFWIYCDLFHHSLSAPYRSSNVTPLPAVMRRDWLKFCVPEERPRKERQSDRIDLFYFLHNICDETVKVLTGVGTRTATPFTLRWVTRIFHTGIPALAFLVSKGANRLPEVVETEIMVKERMVADGDDGIGYFAGNGA